MLKFLHFGIYFKYFLYLFVAVLKDIISDFHIRIMKAYVSLLILSTLFTQKYQNITPGQVDKRLFTIHPHVPRVYYVFFYNNKKKTTSVLKEKSILFYSLFRYSQPWICLLVKYRTWNKSQELRRLLHWLKMSILLQMYFFILKYESVLTKVTT